MRALTFPAKYLDLPKQVTPQCHFCPEPAEHSLKPYRGRQRLNLCRRCAAELRRMIEEEARCLA